MRIMGPPTGDRQAVLDRVIAEEVHPRFIGDMFPALWAAGLRYAVDPVGMVAQAIKETGGGEFPRKVAPWFHNPCGLRVRYLDAVRALLAQLGSITDPEHPLTHHQFGSWTEGARGHAQHLRAYAGCPVPGDELVDPRYGLIIGQHRLVEFEELGGKDPAGRTKWAGSPTYGAELVAIARRLQGGSA